MHVAAVDWMISSPYIFIPISCASKIDETKIHYSCTSKVGCKVISINFPFSEFPTEPDVEDFTGTAVEEEEEEDEEEEEVVEDRDYYYDNYKVDDYNEETPTEPSSDGSLSEKEIISDVKGKSYSTDCMTPGSLRLFCLTVQLVL